MMIKDKDLSFIKDHLDRFGNCACGRRIIMQNGLKVVLEILDQEGYKCVIDIIPDNGKTLKNIMYPPNATYILSLVNFKEGNIHALQKEDCYEKH